MNLTTELLKQLIKEELTKVLNEIRKVVTVWPEGLGSLFVINKKEGSEVFFAVNPGGDYGDSIARKAGLKSGKLNEESQVKSAIAALRRTLTLMGDAALQAFSHENLHGVALVHNQEWQVALLSNQPIKQSVKQILEAWMAKHMEENLAE